MAVGYLLIDFIILMVLFVLLLVFLKPFMVRLGGFISNLLQPPKDGDNTTPKRKGGY